MAKRKNIILNNVSVNIRERSFFARLAAGKMGSKQMAMVFGRTIHLHGITSDEFLNHTSWVKHELCHVEQYKRFGFAGFLFRYLIESIRHGYHNNKFEVEARAAEKS